MGHKDRSLQLHIVEQRFRNLGVLVFSILYGYECLWVQLNLDLKFLYSPVRHLGGRGGSDKPKTDRSFNQHCDTYFELDLYFLHLSGTGGVEFMFIS